MRRRALVATLAVTVCTVSVACGNGESATTSNGSATSASLAGTGTATGTATDTDAVFCDAMAHLIDLLAPTDNSTPTETEAMFAEASTWFAMATDNAPTSIAADVAQYAAAYREYIEFLGTVGYDLSRVFSTPQGRQLAIDTSHSLTPAVVEFTIHECGLSFGDEQPPPTV